MTKNNNSELVQKVKKAQKGFYAHVFIYIGINLFFFINNARLGNTDSKGFYLMIIWGAGVAAHWYFVHLQEEAMRKEMKEKK